MPQYVIPPWIHGADTAGQYGRGFALGQQGGEVQARMALAQMQIAAEQARHEKDFVYRQQQLEMQKALDEQHMTLQKQEFDERIRESQQQLELQKQRFAEQQKMDQMKAQQAATKYAAMQSFQKLVESGMDPDKAALQVGPSLFQSPAGYAALAKEVYAKGKPGFEPTTKDIDGVKMAQLTPNRWTVVRPQGLSMEQKADFTSANKDIEGIRKQLREVESSKNPDPKKINSLEQQLFNAQDIRKGIGKPTPSPAQSEPTTTPAPQAFIWDPESKKLVPKAGQPEGAQLTGTPASKPSLGTAAGPTPLGAMKLAGAMGGGQAGAMAGAQKPPQAPEAPDYIKSYRDELKKAGGSLSEGAKKYLGDMISGLSDEALTVAGQKHGLDFTTEPMDRQDMEEDLTGAVEDQGWQLPWPE